MVAPPQQVPPQGPPPGASGLPPQIAQVAGQLGVPPEALAQALAPLAQRLAQAGVDPGVLLDFLTTIPPQAVGQFLSAPPDQQLQALAEFVQAVQSGQVGPPSAPPPGADLNQPMMGPPGAGPGAGAPAGPAMMLPTSPTGPPSPAPGPLPPNVTPIEQGRRRREQGQPAAEREPPPPDDVELPDLADIAGESPYWESPPSPAQVRRDAWLGRQRWRADYEFVFDQVGAYRMFKDYFGADGRPLRPGLGEVQYKLASFARMVDRAASQAEPRPDEEVLEIPPRAEDRDTKQRTQKAENLLRTRDERERAWWNRRTSRGLVEPPIRTKKFRLLALEGSYAVLYRLCDVGEIDIEKAKRGKKLRPPALLFTREPLSVTEVFPLAHATTVQRRMTFAEACAAEPAVLEQVRKRAKRRGKEFDPEDSSWGVSERTTVVLGEWYDADGLHRLVYWDWDSPTSVGADIRDPSDNGADFFIAKARLDWGFCPVQICPPWNADPSPEGKRGRGVAMTVARDTGNHAGPTRRRYVGAGGKELETQDWKDRIASVMLTTLIGNQHPNVTRTVDPAMVAAGMYETDAGGRPIIPAYLSGPGQQNIVYGGLEKLIVTDRNVSGGSDAALAINILGGESQDAQPAVLGGRGPATSGFETMQRNDAAQSLHVEPMRRAYEDFETYLRGLDLELYLRAGEGKGRLYDELPFRGAVMGAPGNEGTLEVADLKRAGTYATLSIQTTDLVEQLQKNRVWIERVKADLAPRIEAMRELGAKDPEEWNDLIVQDKVIESNPKVQDVLGLRVMKRLDWESYLAYLNSTAPGPGQAGGGGQPGTPPGAPGPQMAPAPGIPAAGLPSIMG